MPGNGPASACEVTSRGRFATVENSASTESTSVPSGESRIRYTRLSSRVVASRSPCIAPPKFVAVYSSSPFVDSGNVASEPRSGPGGSQSHSIGFSTGTGLCVPHVLSVFPRVGFAAPW